MPTYAEIQEHLKNLEAQKAELEQTAVEMKAEALEQMALGVIKYIEDNGFGVREVINRVLTLTARPVTTYVNPDNPAETYSKGPIPGWFKDKMAASGLDPADKEQVKTFKETLPKK